MQATSDGQENRSLLSVSKPPASSSPVSPAGSVNTLTCPKISSERYLLPTANIYPSKATLSRRASSDTQSQSDTNVSVGAGSNVSRTPSVVNGYAESSVSKGSSRSDDSKAKSERRVPAPPTDDLDVQSIINERRPSKLKSGNSTGMMSSVGDQYASSMHTGSYGHIYVTEERSEDVSPISTGNMSDSMMGSTSVSGSGSGSATGSGTGSGSVSGNGSKSGSAVVHIPEGICTTIGSDVRIYVDDTDSTSSNNYHRKKPAEESSDTSTTISSVTAVPDGTDLTEDVEEKSERFDGASSGVPSDPS